MKTTVFFLAFFLFTTISALLYPQDIIYAKNGAVIEGKIIEVNDNIIKYKRKDLPNGPSYSIDKVSISKVQYSNGKIEIYDTPFSNNENNKNDNSDDSLYKTKNNIIGYDVAQFFYISVGIAYERFFGKDNQFSFRIPISVGFNYIGEPDNIIVNDNSTSLYYSGNNQPSYYIYQNGKLAGGAIEFNYYPLGIKRFSYFVGPYFEYGIFAYKIRRYVSEYQNVYGYPQIVTNPVVSGLRYDGQHIAGGITNGFLFHFNKIFTLTGTFGLGLKKDETAIAGERVLTQARFNLIFGIKF
ncbi:MAG: hypothetical protein N2203_03420 [Bacteroidia bacterium]|nr:hypothetical protein [Bacteroidia bacterium]